MLTRKAVVASMVGALAAMANSYPKQILTPAEPGRFPALWKMEELFRVPKATPVNDLQLEFDYSKDMHPIYLEGLPYKGKTTRIFAWVGVPATTDDKPVPGVVLVHGGGGTAFVQ